MKSKIKIFSSAKGYNLASGFYDEKEKYLNSFEQNRLLPLLGDVKDIKILDIGAGTGRLSIPLARQGAEVVALDVSKEILEIIKTKCKETVHVLPLLAPPAPLRRWLSGVKGGLGGVQVENRTRRPPPRPAKCGASAPPSQGGDSRGSITPVVGDAEALPFADSSFDIVIAAFLIVHLKDLTRFFDEAYRVLKDGGLFLVTNINQKEPPKIKTKAGEIIIESFYHRPEKIREILESLAFGIEKEVFVKEGENWVNQIVLARK